MKYYYVGIRGRSNSTILSIKDKYVYSGILEANSHKEAKESAWERFSKACPSYFRRTDFAIESEFDGEWEDL